MTTLEVLTGARALIARPEDWCQGTGAVRRGSRVAYCAVGAVSHVDRYAANILMSPALQLLMQFEPALVVFNDTHTHAEVIALFDRAIAVVQERQLVEHLDAEERAGDAEGLPKYAPKREEVTV